MAQRLITIYRYFFLNNVDMILRNFLATICKFKLATLLNVTGLSIAYTAFLIIITQVNFEYKYDTHYDNFKDIYRLNTESKMLDGMEVGIVSRPVFDTYPTLSSSVEEATIISPSWGTKTYLTTQSDGDKAGFNEVVYDAWKNFPVFFNFKLVEGSFEKFEEPNTLILPRSIAKKIFGNNQAVDKQINIPNYNDEVYTVVAVFEDIPVNSQLKNCIYRHFPKELGVGRWNEGNYLSYVRLNANANVLDVEQAFDKFNLESVSGWMDGVSLFPMKDIYFTEKTFYGDDFLVEKGNKDVTNILIAIAMLVIVIAGINFVNFSTSLAPLRMKSINTQKVLGSPTSTIRASLICEAIGISFFAFILSMCWVYFLSNSTFRDITTAGIGFSGNGTLITMTFIISIIVGLFAGIYPAYYTTKFPPALVLKGNFALGKSGRSLRVFLVGFQYVISIGLIIGSLFLQLQNNYMRNMGKGYNSEQIAVVSLGGEIQRNAATLINKIKENSNIEDIAFAQFRMGRDNMMQGWAKNFTATDAQDHFGAILTSWNFPQLMGIPLSQGEFVKEIDIENENVDNYYIFNKTAQKKYNLNIGQRTDVYDDHYSVISAIVEDFNFKSLHYAVDPIAFVVRSGKKTNQWGSYSYAYIKISGNHESSINHIKKTLKEIDPAYPIEVEFFDAAFEQAYQQDIKTTRLITLFSLLAILISLIGVFGLIVFETQYKRKEIGVRKIMGSTVGQIFIMLNRKFFYIVLACSLIAIPLSYFGVSSWLDGFAYRTPIYWWVFVLGAAIVFAITVITVSVQSYKTATENPVKSLKSE